MAPISYDTLAVNKTRLQSRFTIKPFFRLRPRDQTCNLEMFPKDFMLKKCNSKSYLKMSIDYRGFYGGSGSTSER